VEEGTPALDDQVCRLGELHFDELSSLTGGLGARSRRARRAIRIASARANTRAVRIEVPAASRCDRERSSRSRASIPNSPASRGGGHRATGVAGEELVELRLPLGAEPAPDHSSEVAAEDESRTRTRLAGFAARGN
jgi:hypothetical protein